MTEKEGNKAFSASALVVSLFMATVVAGCSPANPQGQVEGQYKPSGSAMPVQTQSGIGSSSVSSFDGAVNGSPYGGSVQDYCEDDNHDNRCDDNGDEYDSSFFYANGGTTYYGRSRSIQSGVISKGAATIPSSSTTASGITKPDSSTKGGTESTSPSGTTTPSTSTRSGSFSSNGSSTASGTTNSTSSSVSSSSSSSSSSSISSSSSSGISGGSKGGIGSSSSSSGG